MNCVGVCTDKIADSKNCGACGSVCSSGSTCSSGICCPVGQQNCGGECKHISRDNANCGSCGVVCQGRTICRDNACVDGKIAAVQQHAIQELPRVRTGLRLTGHLRAVHWQLIHVHNNQGPEGGCFFSCCVQRGCACRAAPMRNRGSFLCSWDLRQPSWHQYAPSGFTITILLAGLQ